MAEARSYKKLDTSAWDEMAEQNARGVSQADLAEEYGVSPRTIATHLPAALERRRKALAASTGGTAATAPSPIVALAALPSIEDRPAATAAWRASAWADLNALQSRLRLLTADPAPDARAIRALAAGAQALAALVKIGGEIVGADKAADEAIPELVVRELTDDEVAEIRQSQIDRRAAGDLDPEDLTALRDAVAEDHEIVSEGDEAENEPMPQDPTETHTGSSRSLHGLERA